MKLYVHCGNCHTKVYLQSNAPTRTALAQQWGYVFYIPCPHCRSNIQCPVHHVYAETDTDNTVPGAIVGGLLGLLAGPVGVLIGGVLGGATGKGSNESDRKRVNQFNNS